MNIYVNVVEQKLQVSGYPRKFVTGTNEFIRFIFHLNDGWQDNTLTLFVQFKQGQNIYTYYLDEEHSVYLPEELREGACEMSLHGNGNGTIAASEPVSFLLMKNPLKLDVTETSPSLYDQLVTKFANLKTDFLIYQNQFHSGLTQLEDRLDALISSKNSTPIETVLWTGDVYHSGAAIVLSQALNTFDSVDILYGYLGSQHLYTIPGTCRSTVFREVNLLDTDDTGTFPLAIGEMSIAVSDDFKSIQVTHAACWNWDGTASGTPVQIELSSKKIADKEIDKAGHIYKIIGRKTIENMELQDARTGLDGKIYSTVGNAIREQMKSALLNSTTDAVSSGSIIQLTDAGVGSLGSFVLYGSTALSGTPSPSAPAAMTIAGENGTIDLIQCGRNLVKLTPGYVKTSKGITLTVNEDYTISLKGTASEKVYQYLPLICTLPIGSNIYYMSNIISGLEAGDTTSVTVRVNMNGKQTTKTAPVGSGYLLNPSIYPCNQLEINVNAGETVDLKLEIMAAFSSKELLYQVPDYSVVSIPTAGGTASYTTSIGQVVSIPLCGGLAAVPVSTNGTYTDGTGQQYICDTIEYDGTDLKIVKRTDTIESYSGESISTPYISTTGSLTDGASIVYVRQLPLSYTAPDAVTAALHHLYLPWGYTCLCNSAGLHTLLHYSCKLDSLIQTAIQTAASSAQRLSVLEESSSASEERLQSLESDISILKQGNDSLNTRNKIYGIQFDITDPDLICTRIEDAAKLQNDYVAGTVYQLNGGTNDFDHIYPWSDIRCCNVSYINGKPAITYEGEENFARDGSNGNVMVEIPEFYIMRKRLGHTERWYITGEQKSGFTRIPRHFHACYEGSSSVSGIFSKSGAVPLTKHLFADFCADYRQYHMYPLDYMSILAVQYLISIEFADLNLQEHLGIGGYTGAPYAFQNGTMVSNYLCTSGCINGNTATFSNTSANGGFGALASLVSGEQICICDGTYQVIDPRTITALSYSSDLKAVTVTFDGAPMTVRAGIHGICGNPQITGATDSLPYHTGMTARTPSTISPGANANGLKYHNRMKYRGIEDVFGNVWDKAAGLKLYDNQYYFTFDPALYDQNGISGYQSLSFDAPVTGYLSDYGANCITRQGYDVADPIINLPCQVSGQEHPLFGDSFFGDCLTAIPGTIDCMRYGGGWDHSHMAGLFTIRFKSEYVNNQVYWLEGCRPICLI